MVIDAFLQFPKASAAGNILPAGESQDTAFKGAIQITDFTLSVENPKRLGSASGGAGNGKAELNEFVIKKAPDKASGPLFQACCTGAHFPEAVLSLRKAGSASANKSGAVYLTYRFSMIFCTKVEWSGPGDEGPEEEVTFAYGALQVGYQTQDNTGAPTGSVSTVSWNQIGNNPQYPVPPTAM